MIQGTDHPSTYSIPTSITLGLLFVIFAVNVAGWLMLRTNATRILELQETAVEQRATMRVVEAEHFKLHEKLNKILAKYEAQEILHSGQ